MPLFLSLSMGLLCVSTVGNAPLRHHQVHSLHSPEAPEATEKDMGRATHVLTDREGERESYSDGDKRRGRD